MLELAENGDHRNVDMLVRDIYGGPCAALGLPADIIASSFGKAARSSRDSKGSIDFIDLMILNLAEFFYLYLQSGV